MSTSNYFTLMDFRRDEIHGGNGKLENYHPKNTKWHLSNSSSESLLIPLKTDMKCDSCIYIYALEKVYKFVVCKYVTHLIGFSSFLIKQICISLLPTLK